jgi:hypothetical protein
VKYAGIDLSHDVLFKFVACSRLGREESLSRVEPQEERQMYFNYKEFQ